MAANLRVVSCDYHRALTVLAQTHGMNQAQRRRDAALRRLRLTNRAGLFASVAGTLVLIGLAHEATPVGATHRVSAHVVTPMVSTSTSSTRRVSPTPSFSRRKLRPAEAPTVPATATASSQSAPATATVTASSQSAPATPAASSQSTSSPTERSSAGSAGSSAGSAPTPVTSGVS